MKLRLLVSLLFLALVAPALAWWDTGHELVARIAWRDLSEAERLQLNQLLEHHPDPQVRDVVQASVWPDLIKNEGHPFEGFRQDNWHYQNRPAEVEMPEELDEGKMLIGLQESLATLSDQERAPSERAVALAWVIHLVGDIHQPLHNATSYRPEFLPGGDRGGNEFKVMLGERALNLHTWWDSLGGRFLDRPSADALTNFLSELTIRYPRESFTDELTVESFKVWSDEGLKIAREAVYASLRPGQVLGEEVHRSALEIAERRVALAGYRLADVLRRALRP